MSELDFSNLPGWFDYPNYYDFVAGRLKTGESFAEVGVYYGKSIFHLATELRRQDKRVHLYAVDAWLTLTDSVENGDHVLETFQTINSRLKFDIKVVRDLSVDACKSFADGSLSGVYIDASHDYDNVVADIRAWLPKVKPSGFIGGHDYGWTTVRRAVNESFKRVFNFDKYVWHVEKSSL